MANITIENYRGIEIWFDTNNEQFQCDIDHEKSIKKSYTALKKFIDEWKKENKDFKHIKVEPNPNSMYGGKHGVIFGIRKDGRFMIELDNGNKEQISAYNLSDFIISKSQHKELWNQLDELKKEQDFSDAKFRERRNEIKSKFDIITLKDYKKLTIMIRKVTVREDKLPDIVRSLTMVCIASTTALIEYQNYLDVNLKSPVVHQKLKQVKDNLEYTINHIQRKFLTIPDEELTEGVNFKCHELMKLVMRMTEPDLDELLEKLKSQNKLNN